MPRQPIDDVPRPFTVGFSLGASYGARAQAAGVPQRDIDTELEAATVSNYARWKNGQTNYAPPDGPDLPAGESNRQGHPIDLRADVFKLAHAILRSTDLDGDPLDLDLITRLADWMLAGPNPGPAPIDIYALGHDEPVATIQTEHNRFAGNAKALEAYKALRHLATIANDLYGSNRDLIPVSDKALAELDQAIDQAYKALDWPRYPEGGN